MPTASTAIVTAALGETWRQMADVLGPGGLTAIVMDSDLEFTDRFRGALRPYDDVLVSRITADSRAGRSLTRNVSGRP